MDNILLELRKRRNFVVNNWINNKINLLNNYFHKNNLNCCVISVSGGIDSAVTYGLCILASKEKDSPIKKVVGIAQPIKSTESIWKRALELETFGNKIHIIDQSNIHEQLTQIVTKSLNLKDDKFSNGQLKSYMRTPVNYYICQLLKLQNYNAVVMGTGNYDEDGYLYYFCKAGDGVVDLQIISDLHKNEVFKVGKEIGIPNSILDAKPSADLWEDQTDEDEIGVSYDFIEMYTELLKLEDSGESILEKLNINDLNTYIKNSKILKNIHNRNKHKVNFPVNI